MSDMPEIVRSFIDVRHARLAYENHLTQLPQWQLDELKNFMLSNGYREEEFPKPTPQGCRMRWGDGEGRWIAFPRRIDVVGYEEIIDFVLRHLEQRRLL